MKNQASETRLHRAIHTLLEEVRIVRVDVSVQKEGQTIINAVNPLQLDTKAFVLFLVKAGDDIIVVHVAGPPGGLSRLDRPQ